MNLIKNFVLKSICLVSLFIIYITDVSAQCAMCKAVVESNGAESVEEINTGIIYLVTIPYLLIGAVAWFVYKQYKK